MQINNYSFGHISIDGVKYCKDLKIYPDGVESDWWRSEGHLLQPDDLAELPAKNIDHLVVGQGASGLMAVSDATRLLFDKLGITWSAYPTPQAIEEYSRRQEAGEKVGIVLHLTC